MNPDFVTQGEALKSSWANSVVSTLRSSNNSPSNKVEQSKRIYKPFDPISLEYEGTSWFLKIAEGLYFETESGPPIPIIFGASTLDQYPKVEITPNKDLYFNWSNKTLQWCDPNISGNLKILEFIYDGDDFTINNVFARHIDLRQAPPLTPLFSQNGETYKVAVTKGYLCERLPVQTGGAIINHLPSGLLDGGGYIHNDITEEQQLSVVVSVTEFGGVSAVSIAIDDENADSTHYYPKGGDLEDGSGGSYHYKICSPFSNTLGGSHIDHFRDIPRLTNTLDPLSGTTALSGTGRVFKAYDPADYNFIFRTLKQRKIDEPDESQIKVVENDEDITIEGNNKNGSLMINLNGTDLDETKLEWKDGLVTKGEDLLWSFTLSGGDGSMKYQVGDNSSIDLIDWQTGLVQTGGNLVIPIPELEAGSGITITEVGNVFTISTTLSTLLLSGGTGTGSIVIEYPDDGFTETVDLLQWENGLVTTNGDGRIQMTSLSAGEGIAVEQNGLCFTVTNTSTITPPPSSGTYVLMAIDGVMSWAETFDCEGES